MINVLGDALAAGIMAHICKKDFEKAAAAAAAKAAKAANATSTDTASADTAPANNGGGPQRVRMRRIISICSGYMNPLKTSQENVCLFLNHNIEY